MENKHGKINDENKDITTTTKTTTKTIITVPETPSTAISSLPSEMLKQLEDALHNGLSAEHFGVTEIEDNMIPELCEWIAKLGDKLKRLSIFGNYTSIGASFLFSHLRVTNSQVFWIHLISFSIDDECMTSLGEYLQSNQFIKDFELTHSRVSDAGVETLASYLQGNQTLAKLNLCFNKQISSKSVPLLKSIIESSHIRDVDIVHTSISPENIFVVLLATNAIKYGFRMLELARKSINDDNIIQICEIMKKYGIGKLENILLYQNQITSKGACVLFETLRECNSQAKIMSLIQNNINDESMESLGKYIQNNEHIASISLTCNNIGDKGVEILSEYLTGNTTFPSLSIEANVGITDDSFVFLKDIATKSHVETLCLEGTSVSEEKKEAIKALLKIPTEHREIPVKSSSKSAAKTGQ